MIGEFLRRITTALDIHGVPYMLTGSLASSMYGIPRATNDVDIVIAPSREQLVSVVQLFQRIGLTAQIESALAAHRERTRFNVIDFGRGLKADLIVRKQREFSITEFDRRQTHEGEGMRLTVATPEDVLLAKLEWARIGGSEQQISDAAGILKMQRDAIDFAYVQKWVDQLDLHIQWEAARRRSSA